MLILRRNKQNVHFMQRVSSKAPISGLNSLKVDFALTSDSKDVDFT